uniref:Uncharacterized protein n=1 Tax=viral metagenome TaxID=1070528 RepID=A0A6C0CPV4_9ZZZZ
MATRKIKSYTGGRRHGCRRSCNCLGRCNCPKPCRCKSSCGCRRRGGAKVTPYKTYAYPPGPDGRLAQSPQQAAQFRSANANKAQTKAIQHSGGKRKTRKHKPRKHKPRKNKSRKNKSHKNKVKRRTRKLKKKHHKKRLNKKGGKGSGRAVTVPKFGGKSVGPVNANTASQTGNSNKMQANTDRQYDCYATNSCGGQQGGSKSKRLEWHNVYPNGNFGKMMTGGFTGERGRPDWQQDPSVVAGTRPRKNDD